MVQPGGGPRLTHGARDQLLAPLRGQAVRKPDFLDRHLAVQGLVVAAPYPAHAALADQLDEPVPPAHQAPTASFTASF
jgi:predicted dienelactone hydrolase